MTDFKRGIYMCSIATGIVIAGFAPYKFIRIFMNIDEYWFLNIYWYCYCNLISFSEQVIYLCSCKQVLNKLLIWRKYFTLDTFIGSSCNDQKKNFKTIYEIKLPDIWRSYILNCILSLYFSSSFWIRKIVFLFHFWEESICWSNFCKFE